MYYRLLFIIAAVLCLFSFALGQTDVCDQYEQDDYWSATTTVQKSIGSDYRMEARTRVLAQIATQIWSSFDVSQLASLSDKNGIAEETFSEVIKSHLNGVVIEFDVEDVKEVSDKNTYSLTLRLSQKKYCENRERKRNDAVRKSGSILNNLDSFPSKSAIQNLNDIIEILLPYTYNGKTLTYESLEYQLDSGEVVDIFTHTKSLARNYLDRITLKHSIEQYPLINISDNFLFNIHVYDRVTGQPLSNFQIIDKNTKKEKKLFSDNKGIISVKGKVSKKHSRFLYTIDYQSIFPDFIIFPLGQEDYLIEESIFRKPKPSSFNFVLHEESKKISRSGLDILQKDLRKNLSKEYRAIFNKSDNPDYKIVINISYDNFKKNQYGRYVCSVSVVYSLLNNKNDEITDFSIRGIKGMSRTSKDDALKQAAYKIDNLIKEGSNGIFHKFSEAIHNF